MVDTPIQADLLVKDCAHKQAAVAWPLPVDMVLDNLLAQAGAAGENTSRKELAAAIVATTRLTDGQLGKMLRRYRTARVRELVPVPAGQNVVPFVRRRPGPRTANS
jgi:hypothetical protein